MTDRNVDDLIREWTDIGEEHLPDRYLQAALAEIETTPQSGAWPAPLEGLIMRIQRAAPYVAVAAAVLMAAVLYLALARPPVGDDASPPALPSVTSSPEPSGEKTAAPSDTGEATPRAVQTATIELGGRLASLVATSDAVFAGVGSQIVRIDPATGDTFQLLDIPDVDSSCSDCLGGPETPFAIGEGSIWVAYHYETQSVVRRFDLESGAAEAEITLGTPDGGGAGASDVVVAFGSVWTVQCHSGTVARIDPSANQQVELVQLADGAFCGNPYSIAADDDNLWVTMKTDDGSSQKDWVFKLDTAGATIGSSLVEGSGTPCGRFATDAALGVWINSCPDSEDSALIRIAPSAAGAEPGPASLVRLGGYLGSPALIEGRVWVPRVASRPTGPSVLVGVDPDSGEVVDAIRLALSSEVSARVATPLIVAFDSVWVGGDSGTLVRIPLAELSR